MPGRPAIRWRVGCRVVERDSVFVLGRDQLRADSSDARHIAWRGSAAQTCRCRSASSPSSRTVAPSRHRDRRDPGSIRGTSWFASLTHHRRDHGGPTVRSPRAQQAGPELLRHPHVVEVSRAGVPLVVIPRQLGTPIGITSAPGVVPTRAIRWTLLAWLTSGCRAEGEQRPPKLERLLTGVATTVVGLDTPD